MHALSETLKCIKPGRCLLAKQDGLGSNADDTLGTRTPSHVLEDNDVEETLALADDTKELCGEGGVEISGELVYVHDWLGQEYTDRIVRYRDIKNLGWATSRAIHSPIY